MVTPTEGASEEEVVDPSAGADAEDDGAPVVDDNHDAVCGRIRDTAFRNRRCCRPPAFAVSAAAADSPRTYSLHVPSSTTYRQSPRVPCSNTTWPVSTTSRVITFASIVRTSSSRSRKYACPFTMSIIMTTSRSERSPGGTSRRARAWLGWKTTASLFLRTASKIGRLMVIKSALFSQSHMHVALRLEFDAASTSACSPKLSPAAS